MFLIEHVEYLEFKTPNLESMTKYYQKYLGLIKIEESTVERVLLGFGNQFPSLILQKSNTASLGEVCFKVRGKNEWEVIIDRLTKRDIPFETTESKLYGTELRFKDQDGHPLKLYYSQYQSAQTANTPPRFGPALNRLQHVTYASPKPMKLASFYQEILNFRISDMVEGGNFVWMRTDTEHHTVAVAAHTTEGLDHFAFELPDWASFKEWCDYLCEQNVEIVWGPGRHGPGNNLFFFTLDPDGNRVEYSCELEKFRDHYMDYTPRAWRNDPKSVNLWGPGAPWKRELPK